MDGLYAAGYYGLSLEKCIDRDSGVIGVGAVCCQWCKCLLRVVKLGLFTVVELYLLTVV